MTTPNTSEAFLEARRARARVLYEAAKILETFKNEPEIVRRLIEIADEQVS